MSERLLTVSESRAICYAVGVRCRRNCAQHLAEFRRELEATAQKFEALMGNMEFYEAMLEVGACDQLFFATGRRPTNDGDASV